VLDGGEVADLDRAAATAATESARTAGDARRDGGTAGRLQEPPPREPSAPRPVPDLSVL